MDATFLSAQTPYMGNNWHQELKKDWGLLLNLSIEALRKGGNMLPIWRDLKVLYEKKYTSMPKTITWKKPVPDSKVHEDPKLDGDFQEDGKAYPIHFKNQLVRIPLFEKEATPRKVLQLALNAGQASIFFLEMSKECFEMSTYVEFN